MALVRKNGQLQEVSEEELQNLSKAADLPAPPTSPSGAAGLGASEDAAKMAGTKAQKTAALDVAAKPQETLAGAERQAAPRTEATTEEQAASKKQQQLATMGSLGSRVDQLIDVMFKPQDDAVVQIRAASLEELPEDVRGNLGPMLSNLAATTDPGEQLQILEQIRAMARNRGVDLELSPESVSKYFEEAGIAGGAGIAAAVDDQITVAQLDPAALGFESSAEMAGLLGVSPGELEAMTLAQLQERVAQVQQEDFQRVDRLQRELADPNTSPARREQLQRELAGLSQVGVTGVESQMESLTQSIEQADLIEFGGQEMKVEELLDNEKISDMVAQYLENPDSEFAKGLAKEEPGFVEWIGKHEQALEKAVEQLESAAGKLQAKEDFATQLKELGGITLGTDVIDAMFPKGEFSPEDVKTLQDSDFYKMMLDPNVSKTKRESVARFLEKGAEIDPEIIKDFVKLPRKFLDKRVGRYLDTYIDYRKQLDQFDTLDPKNADAMLDFVFGQNVSVDQIKKRMEEEKVLQQAGFPNKYNELKRKLGDPLDPKTLYSKIKGGLKTNKGAKDLDDWISKRDVFAHSLDLKKTSGVRNMTKEDRAILNKALPALKDDGQLNLKEMLDVGMHPNSLKDIKTLGGLKLGPKAKEQVEKQATALMKKQVYSMIEGVIGRRLTDQALSGKITTPQTVSGTTTNTVKYKERTPVWGASGLEKEFKPTQKTAKVSNAKADNKKMADLKWSRDRLKNTILRDLKKSNRGGLLDKQVSTVKAAIKELDSLLARNKRKLK